MMTVICPHCRVELKLQWRLAPVNWVGEIRNLEEMEVGGMKKKKPKKRSGRQIKPGDVRVNEAEIPTRMAIIRELNRRGK